MASFCFGLQRRRELATALSLIVVIRHNHNRLPVPYRREGNGVLSFMGLVHQAKRSSLNGGLVHYRL